MVIAGETILLGLGDYTLLYSVYFLYHRIGLMQVHQCETQLMNEHMNDAQNTNTSSNSTYNMMVCTIKVATFMQYKLVSVIGLLQ